VPIHYKNPIITQHLPEYHTISVRIAASAPRKPIKTPYTISVRIAASAPRNPIQTP
jgi:hypothetical protein